MKFTIATASLIATLAISVPSSAYAQKSGFVLIDVPNSGAPVCAPSGCGTYGYATNGSGTIVGYYIDPNIVAHGFLRSLDGHFITIDVPGAALTDGQGEGVYALSLNNRGEIAGQFLDSSLVYHGFIRYPDGRLVIFDAPGAGNGILQGTLGEGINPAGEVVGYYVDENNVSHGFVRGRDGVIITFDAPGAGSGGVGQGTFACEKCINPAGEIDGSITDSNNVNHGFVRHRDGTFTIFDAPGAGPLGTTAAGINPNGAVTGYVLNGTNEAFGFVRDRDGSITTFGAPGSGTGSFQGTAGFSINSAGAVTGITIDSNNVLHGFLRSPGGGSYITLNAPGAGRGAFQGTRPEFVGPAGVVIGFFFDANGVSHGFEWNP